MKKKIICLITAMTLLVSQGITAFAVDNVGELEEANVEIKEETALDNTESSNVISAVEGISGDVTDVSTGSSTDVENKEPEDQLKEIYDIEKYDSGIENEEIELNTEYTGVVSTQGEVDFYKFTLTQPGVVSYSFSNEYKDTTDSWFIELVGPNTTSFYSQYDVMGKNDDTVTSPQFGLGEGTYYLKVNSFHVVSEIYNVPYHIKINYSATNEWEAEANASADTANELTLGEEKKGNLYSSSDVDIYKVTIPQQGKISLDFTNDKDTNDPTASWLVKLGGLSDDVLFSQYVNGDNKYTVSSLEYGVSAGTYYVRIDGYKVDLLNYRVKLNYIATNECEAEPNDSTDKATEIPVGTDIHGNLCVYTDIDYYKVIIPQTGKISIKFNHEYADNDKKYYVKLIDSSGNNLFSGEREGRNVETLQSDAYDVVAGTYFVKIDGGLDNNNYKINVNYSSPSAGATSFVTRLYEVGLNRLPEADGLNYWTNSLMSGEKKAVDVVQGVLCSQEYSNKGKSNGEVVNDCYQAMLGRDADKAGYADWTSQLDAGMSVNAIFAGFVGSEEFANLCASYGIQPGTFVLTEERDKNAGVTKFVSRLYTQALGRAYDVDGLNDWCGKINANPSRENILNISTNGFFHSQEFTNKNLDNTEFVKVLYRTFLGREYDDAGLANWVGQLDRGENTRDGVIGGFANSQEFSNIMAQYGL